MPVVNVRAAYAEGCYGLGLDGACCVVPWCIPEDVFHQGLVGPGRCVYLFASVWKNPFAVARLNTSQN